MTTRFIIEGTWNGRVVHRSVHPESSKELRDWVKGTGSISYPVGGKISLTARDLGAGEMPCRDALKSHYGELIARCARYDVDSVDALIAAERLA